ncbi:MAG: hypothetical protein R3B09_15415 [Nannocystaceae bacterium]
MERITLPSTARMRPSLRNRGVDRRWRRLAASATSLALVAASSPASAGEPRSRSAAEIEAQARADAGDHVGSAERWAEVAATADDPKTRTLATFRGYQSWLAAHAEDHDASRLCAARSLLVDLTLHDDLDERVRGEAMGRLADLDAQLAGAGESEACLVDAREDDVREEAPPRVPSTAVEAPVLLPMPARPTSAERARVDAPHHRHATARPFTIAGGVALGVGGALLGVMVYGAVVDARSALALVPYNAKKSAGTLTADDWVQIEEIGAEGLAGARLARGSGVAAAAAIVTGAALLIHARRIRQRTLALYPAVGLGQAGLGLKGRF